jgi:hypothetical protein
MSMNINFSTRKENLNFLKNAKFILGVFLVISSCTPQSEDIVSRVFSEIQTYEEITFKDPLKRFKSYDDFFSSYNFYTKAIYKHGRNFETIDTLGKEGDAPYENRMVLNYSILNDSTLAIFDSEKNTFKIQDWNDSVYFYHKFQRNFERGELLNDSILVITEARGSRYKMGFGYVNLYTNEYSSMKFANDVLNEELSFFTYEGIIIADGSDIYSFSYNYTDFLKISLDDSMISKLNYGYPLEKKKPEVFEINGGFMTGDNPQYIMDAHIDEKFIWILSNVSEKGFENNRILDVYLKEGFLYLKSYVLPNIDNDPPSEMFKDDDYFYLRSENIILKVTLD